MNERTLVLMPGLDGTGVLFRPLVSALPVTLRAQVVAYPPDVPLSYLELRDRILEVLPFREPFALVAESFSGPLAILVAAKRPANLTALVLCATFVRNPHPYVPPVLGGFARPVLFSFFPLFAQAKALMAGYSSPELRKLFAEAHGQVSPAVMAYRIRAILAIDVTRELLQCPCPILYIRGTRDMVVPAWNARQITRLRPDVREIALPAPHLVLQTTYRQAIDVVGEFLQQPPGIGRR